MRLPSDLEDTISSHHRSCRYAKQKKIWGSVVRVFPKPVTYVNPALATNSHVFGRHDATRKPLQQPCDGPFKVVKRAAKYYTVDINGRHDTVSLDRLKPAFCEQSGVPTTSTRNKQSASPPYRLLLPQHHLA